MCGIIGIFGPSGVSAAQALYDGLIAIQHRGQDAAGIVTFNRQFHLAKGTGLVQHIFDESNISRLTGSMGIGHVRYPTYGSGTVEDAQPFIEPHPFGVAMAHNGQVTNFRQMKAELETQARRHVNSGCDVEIILHVFADELARAVPADENPRFEHVERAVMGVHRRVRGAYSVVTLVVGLGLVAFRDPYGIRPLVMGQQQINGEACFGFASESVALAPSGYHSFEDVKAGEIVLVRLDRTVERAVPPTAQEARPCIFEYVYFARPDSFHDDVSVYHARMRMGVAMADAWKRTGIPVDVIVPVPDSSRPSATEMAIALGVKYREGLIKNRYIGRTFIMAGNESRRRAIRYKLNTVDLVFQDKDVLLVDDSIVRGNTIRELIRLVRDAGARKVYFASYSAPLVSPCVYGIDMSTRGDFIATNKTSEQIAEEVGADFLLYQDLNDMIRATRREGGEQSQFCTACFTGRYPTGDVGDAVLKDFETERVGARLASG